MCRNCYADGIGISFDIKHKCLDEVPLCGHCILLHSTHKCVPGKKKREKKREGFACTHAEESFTNCQVSMVRHSLWEAPVKEEEHWFVCRTKVYRSL